MSQLIISTSIQSGQLVVKLDDNVILRNNGSVTINLNQGDSHNLQCFVEGTPGSEYNITITSPLSASLQRTRTIDNTGQDFVGFDFIA